MTSDDKLNTLYDMSAVTMECIEVIDKKVEKRKVFDKFSVAIGGVVGGVIGAIGERFFKI